jgi:hypothetical protein
VGNQSRSSKVEARLTTPDVGVSPVRPGHWNSLKALIQPEFSRIIELFDRAPEIGGTYFRLVEKGFQPVDLDPRSPKPLMGIGGSFGARATVAILESELAARIACLVAKRRTKSKSVEKQVEAKAVRGALRSNLRLQGLGENLRLIASQWRIDLGGHGEPLDLLAVDVKTSGLVVIELKATKDERAILQARRYAENISQHGEVTGPFFAALGVAMARLYDCSDLPELLVPGLVTALAAWPTGLTTFEVIPCP